MTLLPTVSVSVSSTPPPPPPATDTATFFVVGFAQQGPIAGQVGPNDDHTSLGDWIATHGPLQSYNGNDYACVEGNLAEGASRLYFSRKAGPSALQAHIAVPASSSQFTAKAKWVGDYANGWTIGVASSVITIKDSGANVLEVSPTLTDLNAAAAWAAGTSKYLGEIDLLVSNTTLTNSAAVTFASGTDDRGSIGDTQIQAALDRFPSTLGPGQLLMPGDARIQAYTMGGTHCKTTNCNRFMEADGVDSATASDNDTLAASITALGVDIASRVHLLEPWLQFPGINGGAPRWVPPSCVMAGLDARCDALGNPSRAVAGPKFASRYALDVKYHRSDAERLAHSAAGVTPFIVQDGAVMPFDDILPVNQVTSPQYASAGAMRMLMRIVADVKAIGKNHQFDEESGQDDDYSTLNGDVSDMLAGWYRARALYGAVPAEAYRVVTDASVNTPGANGTIAQGQLNVALALVFSKNSRAVNITITNTPIGVAV